MSGHHKSEPFSAFLQRRSRPPLHEGAHNLCREEPYRKHYDRSTIRKVAFVGNFPPRQCGIASFTADLLNAMVAVEPLISCFTVAVNGQHARHEYTEAVKFEIEEQDLSSYLRAAEFLNVNNVDVVCLQHEFGIFGGSAGGHILALMRNLRRPVVTTLHTVLRNPEIEQRQVMEEILMLSARVVVMAERGKEMLQEVYNTPESKIDLIPHGIPDSEFLCSTSFKKNLDLQGNFVLLTFGLLSPNKGIENVLKALPAIAEEFPNVLYIILGATHPNELRQHGDAYRISLKRIAQENGIEAHVMFCNQFVDKQTLKAFIGATDVYITPYQHQEQITSGTLAYTFGAGKAIVSTPYWHAAELLADGRGILVPFNDAPSIANAVADLLRDDQRLHKLSRNAYVLGREMTWAKSAHRYRQSFETARAEEALSASGLSSSATIDLEICKLPPIKLTHLSRMTDSTGLFQHACFNVPNFSEGYCTDDNARALILVLLLAELGDDSELVKTLTSTYAAFLNHAFDEPSSRFRNFMSFDRRWLELPPSEDAHGRAIWALGTAVKRSKSRGIQMLGEKLFCLSAPVLSDFTSPRAWAFGLIGIQEYLLRFAEDHRMEQLQRLLLRRIMELSDASFRQGWLWFEEYLSYDNAKIPHALIQSGQATGQPAVIDRGLQALQWLLHLQRSKEGLFRPIGSNGFHTRGGERALFDQQPIEAHATVSACLEAYRVTSDFWWYQQAKTAFDWFLGSNDLGLRMCNVETGACCDGLHLNRLNENQGAESMLAFLLSLVEIKLAKKSLSEPPG